MNTSRHPTVTPAKRGFTLIELLVVIAIIALLAAILFPVFARARENARRTNCMSNEKQQALGLMQYAQDYDERLPATWFYGHNLLPWHVLLQPYVKSYQIFRCPSVRNLASSPVNNISQYWSTYGLPGIGNTEDNKVIYSYNGTHLSSISEPSRTWMIVETAYKSRYDDDYLDKGWGQPIARLEDINATEAVEPNSLRFSYDLHFDGYNVAFADGHVKWIKTGTARNWIFDLNRVP